MECFDSLSTRRYDWWAFGPSSDSDSSPTASLLAWLEGGRPTSVEKMYSLRALPSRQTTSTGTSSESGDRGCCRSGSPGYCRSEPDFESRKSLHPDCH